MIRPIRLRPEATEAVLIKLIGEQLQDIYSNKSSEEYKMRGDITKSSTYEKIEIGISELKTLKGFNKNDAKDMETMFMTLHKPIFKNMVNEYIAKPEDRNVVFTSIFTVGYRLIVSELSRIIASTEATKNGIVYKPDKASRHQAMTKFIRYMNSSIEASIDKELKKVKEQNKNNDSTVQEAFNPMSIASGFVNDFMYGMQVMDSIFHAFISSNNPLSTISSLINLSIESKVIAYDNAVAAYESTKEAYNEYLRTPESQRKKSVIDKYEKMMNKYNMKVNQLKAKIAHYDQRANSKTEDDINKAIDDSKKNASSSKDNDTTKSNDDNNNNNDFDF